MSNPYAAALAAHLTAHNVKQDELAGKIDRTQVAVSRYVNGARFPDLETARLIDTATEGSVPLSLWQRVALGRLGIDEAEAA